MKSRRVSNFLLNNNSAEGDWYCNEGWCGDLREIVKVLRLNQYTGLLPIAYSKGFWKFGQFAQQLHQKMDGAGK